MKISDSAYLIECPYYDIGIRLGLIAREELVILDTGTASTFEDAILPFMQKTGFKKIHKAINLHGHQDHVGSNAQLKEYFGTQILCHRIAAPYLENVDAGLAFFAKYFKYFAAKTVDEIKRTYYVERGRASSADKVLSDGDIVLSDNIELEMIAAPGHDESMLCVFDRSDRILYTSDAIQGRGVISRQFPSLPLYENVDAYIASMRRLMKVDFEQLVPGHPYAPYNKLVLNRDEGLDLIDQSLKAVENIDRIARLCLEENKEPLDLYALTACVQRRVTGGDVTAQALCTVNAHIQKLISEGNIRIIKVKSEEAYTAL
jgi:glyoxylase-like metal-dependent hydrolase (beta-lactamase superfamily II)